MTDDETREPTDRERLDAAMGAIRILGREVRALRAKAGKP